MLSNVPNSKRSIHVNTRIMLIVENNSKKKTGFTVKEKIREYGRKRQLCRG